MRRIVLVLVLVVIVAIAGYMLVRPKHGQARAKSTTAVSDTSSYAGATATTAQAARPAGGKARVGKVAGTLRASTAEQRRVQKKAIRDAEVARKRQLKLQAREKKRMLARAGRARGGRARGSKGQGLYVLKAIVTMGNGNYAMVDTRKVQVGDVVLGRRIVSIGQDRIEIEAFGKLSTVRVGESLVPSS